jgi:hypothetical protein
MWIVRGDQAPGTEQANGGSDKCPSTAGCPRSNGEAHAHRLTLVKNGRSEAAPIRSRAIWVSFGHAMGKKLGDPGSTAWNQSRA